MAASYKIAAAVVVDNLSTIGLQNSEMRTIGLQILPTTERQVRPLTQLEPSQQREVWQQAVEEAGGKVPSSRLVKDIVQRIRERTRVPIPYLLEPAIIITQTCKQGNFEPGLTATIN
jgi:hypothetical protein